MDEDGGAGRFTAGRLLHGVMCPCGWIKKKIHKRLRPRSSRGAAVGGDANLFPQPLLLVSHALVVGFADPLAELLLLRGAAAEEHVVYKGILEQGQEHEHETAHEVDVDGFHVWNLWESLPKVGVNGCHGEHRCHS